MCVCVYVCVCVCVCVCSLLPTSNTIHEANCTSPLAKVGTTEQAVLGRAGGGGGGGQESLS